MALRPANDGQTVKLAYGLAGHSLDSLAAHGTDTATHGAKIKLLDSFSKLDFLVFVDEAKDLLKFFLGKIPDTFQELLLMVSLLSGQIGQGELRLYAASLSDLKDQ